VRPGRTAWSRHAAWFSPAWLPDSTSLRNASQPVVPAAGDRARWATSRLSAPASASPRITAESVATFDSVRPSSTSASLDWVWPSSTIRSGSPAVPSGSGWLCESSDQELQTPPPCPAPLFDLAGSQSCAATAACSLGSGSVTGSASAAPAASATAASASCAASTAACIRAIKASGNALRTRGGGPARAAPGTRRLSGGLALSSPIQPTPLAVPLSRSTCQPPLNDQSSTLGAVNQVGKGNSPHRFTNKPGPIGA
jgi:hypothetical protein